MEQLRKVESRENLIRGGSKINGEKRRRREKKNCGRRAYVSLSKYRKRVEREIIDSIDGARESRP